MVCVCGRVCVCVCVCLHPGRAGARGFVTYPSLVHPHRPIPLGKSDQGPSLDPARCPPRFCIPSRNLEDKSPNWESRGVMSA